MQLKKFQEEAVDDLISKSKNTSIEDKKMQGKVLSTFVNGEELYKTN